MLSYLDNAATTFPKPISVYNEVYKCMSRYCGNAGRGSHKLSLEAAKKIFECRTLIADKVGVDEVERIIFTYNTTYAINTVIKGVLKKGDHVIISDMEHNAVLRPIWKLAREGAISYDIFPTMVNDQKRSPTLICAKIASLLKPNTKMVICTHASNICSAIFPIKEIGEFCKKHSLFLLVDGAQSVGHYPINVDAMNISALCFPSHKGLYGPQGCGVIALGKGVYMDTLIEGGNGVNSLEADMPLFLPERYEAGTLPTPTIAGLCEGIKFLNRFEKNEISEYEAFLFSTAYDNLSEIDNITIYVPSYQGPVLLFNLNSIPSEKVARYLDSLNICSRSGFHCAALAHKTLGTPSSGAVRASLGIFNSKSDVDRLSKALLQMKREV